MKRENETYVHITIGTGENEETKVLPQSRVAKMTEKQEAFNQVNEQAFSFATFESEEEFASTVPDAAVRLDIVNRAVMLKQQQLARQTILASDFAPSTEAVDLLPQVGEPSERRAASTVVKTKNNLLKLAKEDPAAFAQLLAEFQQAGA